MDEEAGIKNERVDDIPPFLAQMARMGIQCPSRTGTGRAEASLQRRIEYTRSSAKFMKKLLKNERTMSTKGDTTNNYK